MTKFFKKNACTPLLSLPFTDSIATNSSHGYTILSTVSMAANLTLVTAATTETTTTDSSTKTSYSPIATTPTDMIVWDVGSPDLISVAIVGSVFAVVLVVCIILGCREKKETDPGKYFEIRLRSH